jgi:predicted O-methyltransferase YrrM
MALDQWTEVDQYFASRLLPADSVLDAVLEASALEGLPAISVTPSQGKLLQMLAQMVRARSILEIGTLGGYSTIWLARGLLPGGRVITLEVEPHHAQVAQQNLERAGLNTCVEVRLGSAVDTLAELSREDAGPFDMIFIDADKQNIPAYFEWSLKLSHPGTLIVVDNVVRDGAVVDSESTDPSVMGVRKFVELLGSDGKVSGTAIQTVGAKGYDGLAILLVAPAT